MSDSCNPMDYSPPGSSVHGISQARIVEWVVISFSRGSSRPRDRNCVSCVADGFFITQPPGKPRCPGTSCSMVHAPWHVDHSSWQGIEPVPPAMEAQSLSHWTAREVLNVFFNVKLSLLSWDQLSLIMYNLFSYITEFIFLIFCLGFLYLFMSNIGLLSSFHN